MKNDDMAKVKIIILNWNGKDDTCECVDSLLDAGCVKSQIIIVDNGSNDGSVAVFCERYPDIKTIVNDANLGYAGGNNIGIRKAIESNAEYILILNNDTTVEPGFLEPLVNTLKNEKYDIAGPKILNYWNKELWAGSGSIIWFAASPIQRKILGIFNKSTYSRKTTFVTGCAMMVRKDVFIKIGMLDPEYVAYYEDLDFCYRATNNNFKCKYVAESIIYHKVSATGGFIGKDTLSPFQAYFNARNGFLFCKKNLTRLKKWQFLLGHFSFRFIYFFILALKSKNVDSLKKLFQGYKDGIFKYVMGGSEGVSSVRF